METSRQKTVLIADDEERMRRVIADYLSIKGYKILEAADGAQALTVFHKHNPDLVLLDVMMPRIGGFAVCRRIRETSTVPIIMLTARGQEEDELQGFSLGVDEYVTKPFSLKVLLARIEAVFRRGTLGEELVHRENLEVDKAGREVHVGDQLVELTYTEFELLVYLMENEGIALSRDRILDKVWRYDYFGDARTVDTHIKKLRSKLGSAGDRIKTIRGIGYKFEE